MKKTLSFLCSMKFGMILLVIILILCFAGSMIVQGRSAEEYIARYGEPSAKLIQALALDHVFSAPYFIIVGLALVLNLIDCSASRFKTTLKMSRTFEDRSEKAPVIYNTDIEKAEKLKNLLIQKHFHRVEKGEKVLFIRDKFGFWGSFFTHLSLLLILIIGTFVLYGAKVQDLPVMPGESAKLDDGTEISVSSFRTTDSKGSLDYASEISITLPDGRSSGVHEIKVNQPLRMGKYKVYQQNYYHAGYVDFINDSTGETSSAYLDESCFLTLDGTTGYYFEGLFSGYKKAEDGRIVLDDATSLSDQSNPVYMGYAVSENGMEAAMLFPGDKLSAGGITFTIGETVDYPGLRIKELSGALLVALYLVFAMIIIGLWMLFFRVPISIAIGSSGFSLTSSKTQTGLLLELEAHDIIQNVSL